MDFWPVISHLLAAIMAAVVTIVILGMCGAYGKPNTKASDSALAQARAEGASAVTAKARLDAYLAAYSRFANTIVQVMGDHNAANLAVNEAMERIKAESKTSAHRMDVTA